MKKGGFLFFITAIFLLLLASCKKDPVTKVLDFSRITTTDDQGYILGIADSTDWTFDSIFLAKELALLNFNDTNVKVTDTLTGNVTIQPAYPNPGVGIVALSLNTERECKFKIVCVNDEMQTLYYHMVRLSGGDYTAQYNFTTSTSFHKPANYRIYYGFYNSRDSLYYKGHGDIRLE